MLSLWKGFMRSQAGEVAVEYNVIATGVAIVASVAMLAAANVIADVIFRDVTITLGQGYYSASYDAATSTATASGGETGGETQSSSTSTSGTQTPTCRSGSLTC